MKFSNAERASVLVQALPYIKTYNGTIVVVKYGGNAMENEELKLSVMKDLVLLWLIGVQVVLIHGGGPEISQTLNKIGKESKFLDGLRVTDDETIDVVQMVLAGKVNKDLVNLLEVLGGKAIGLSGIDGHMIEAKVKDKRLQNVGEITKVRIEPIIDILEKGYIPVISTIGCDAKGNVYNINADTAAAKIAGELKAEAFIVMTNTNGLMNGEKKQERIPVLDIQDAPALVESGIISGGMIPKVESCIDALNWGVKRVFIINGTIPHAILIETLTDEGIGTMFIDKKKQEAAEQTT